MSVLPHTQTLLMLVFLGEEDPQGGLGPRLHQNNIYLQKE